MTKLRFPRMVNFNYPGLWSYIACIFLAQVCMYACSSSAFNCSSSSDCPSDQCCVSVSRPRGKRDLGFPRGTCQEMSALGSDCFVVYQSGKPKNIVYRCPCVSGLTCVGTGNIDVPLGEMGVCRQEAGSREKRCAAASDCGDDECCFSPVRPLGKRSIRSVYNTCKKRGQVGSKCFTRYNSVNLDAAMYMCPCAAGLRCVGTGVIDIPLGEIGTCKVQAGGVKSSS